MQKAKCIIYITLLMSIAFSHSAVGQTPGQTHTQAGHSTSKRIEVYSVSQHYWDVSPGQTLAQIVAQLLPHNPAMRKSMQNEILRLNPHAFSQSNPHNLKANVRLWLPHYARLLQHNKNPEHYEVQSFSWGQIYRAK